MAAEAESADARGFAEKRLIVQHHLKHHLLYDEDQICPGGSAAQHVSGLSCWLIPPLWMNEDEEQLRLPSGWICALIHGRS